MPSFDHELLVDLFRNDGKLAVELLGTCAGFAVDHARVELGSIDLSQVAPTGYRADAVVVLPRRRSRRSRSCPRIRPGYTWTSS